MKRYARFGLLIIGLGFTALLAGCPGMPGAPGGGGNAAQQTPPGILPPPGLSSGGVRTIMGTTVTAPEDAVLLVSYTSTTDASATDVSVRRITISENTVLIEGQNFEARDTAAPKDTNVILSLTQIESLTWSYEAKPTPPPAEDEKSDAPAEDEQSDAPTEGDK